MKNSIALLGAFLFLSFPLFFAQQKPAENSDSLNARILTDYSQNLAKMQAQHQADSIKRLELENQIKSLKSNEGDKKEHLNQQLQELSTNESKRFTERKNQIELLRLTAKIYPVMGFFQDTLFPIYSGIGSFSAKDRASAVENRIKQLAKRSTFQIDSLRLVYAETSTDIIYNDLIVISITEDDALWNNTSVDELAKNYRSVIQHSINEYQSETSVSSMLKKIGIVLLVLFITGIILFYVKKLLLWTAEKIIGQKGKLFRGIKLKKYTLFDATQQVNLILWFNKVIKWTSYILLIYTSLSIILGIFPWTKNIANSLVSYILNPVKNMGVSFVHYLPKLFTIIIIVFLFRYALKALRYLKTEVERGKLTIPGFYTDWANPTYQIFKVVLYAFMAIAIFPYLPGSDSPVFQGVSVFLGVLFTFGSSGSLSNIVAGLVITYMRLFKVGDRVQIGEVTGDVLEKTLLVTRIRTIKNELISIPNSTVMSSHTVNYSSDAEKLGLILHTTVTIGYDVPWKDMHQALLNAADRTELILKDPKPFVLQTSLDDFYVSYQINAYTNEANQQATIYSHLHENIQDCCNEVGIEILSPHYRAARDGNSTTIPENYRDPTYQAPPFKVKVEK